MTTMLGDTPGPLGVGDGASQDLPLYSTLIVPISGAMCRAADGTPLSVGSNPPRTAATGGQECKITTALLRAADGSNSTAYYDSILAAMNEYATSYKINTPLRIAHFLAQIGHESGFRMVEENGNYSAKRMRQIFGCKGGPTKYVASTDECLLGRLRDKLWTEESKYANNARNLLSYVYAQRLKNGDEASGDGYKFRGRGMMQLTFKDNYSAFTSTHNAKNPVDKQDFVATPDLLVTEQKYGIESAFFYWNSRSLNAVADSDDVEKVTLMVNGGTIGLSDRKARLTNLKKALGI